MIPGRTWILLYLGRTMYKHLWACLALYGGPRWTLCQFQRDQRNNKQFDSFYFILFNYFILGYFWPKTGVGQTSPEWIQVDPDESSQYQLVFCDITDITGGAKMWHFLNYYYEWNNQCRQTVGIHRTPKMQTIFVISWLFKKLQKKYKKCDNICDTWYSSVKFYI